MASNRNTPFKRRWAIDLSKRGDKSGDSITSPPGYTSSYSQVNVEETREVDSSLVVKKSWDIALSPLKSAPMNLILMYMAGGSISIFPIMMVGMMLMKPVKALWSLKQTFKSIEGRLSALQKLIYLFGNLVNVGLALYKCQSMGLLPTHASDWLAFQEPAIQMEFSHGGLSLT